MSFSWTSSIGEDQEAFRKSKSSWHLTDAFSFLKGHLFQSITGSCSASSLHSTSRIATTLIKHLVKQKVRRVHTHSPAGLEFTGTDKGWGEHLVTSARVHVVIETAGSSRKFTEAAIPQWVSLNATSSWGHAINLCVSLLKGFPLCLLSPQEAEMREKVLRYIYFITFKDKARPRASFGLKGGE